MKRYEATTNCENAEMVEMKNGDWMDYDDVEKVVSVFEDLLEQLGKLPHVHPQHPLQISVKKAQFAVRRFRASS